MLPPPPPVWLFTLSHGELAGALIGQVQQSCTSFFPDGLLVLAWAQVSVQTVLAKGPSAVWRHE